MYVYIYIDYATCLLDKVIKNSVLVTRGILEFRVCDNSIHRYLLTPPSLSISFLFFFFLYSLTSVFCSSDFSLFLTISYFFLSFPISLFFQLILASFSFFLSFFLSFFHLKSFQPTDTPASQLANTTHVNISDP